LIGWHITHGPARKTLGLLLVAFTITLFLLNLRRAGRVAERRSTSERTHDVQSQKLDAASRLPADRDAFAQPVGMAGSHIWPNICPPVLHYSQETRILAALEVEGMRLGAVIAGLLCDYTMMRELSRHSPAR
jgi:hypothetical protein